ncbi:MAG: glucoamylase family protein, partial [Acidobacteriota bacterium]
SYYDRDTPTEQEIRTIAEQLYNNADWTWTQVPDGTVSMGWGPEKQFIDYQWHGLDEAMILYVMALGSETHPIDEKAWSAWTSTYKWGTYYGQDHLGFPPLFGHQYSQIWIDFRGIQDAYMRERGIDYFENSRRATLAQHSYAVDNPGNWDDYGEDIWGLTACYGPLDATVNVHGTPRKIATYTARGADFMGVNDDGTIAPTAAVSSIVFAPEIVLPTIAAMEVKYGNNLYLQYGFVDAFNPSLKDGSTTVDFGKIVPGVGWFDTSYLGIDQGPIVAMIENYRSELIWKTMRRNPHIIHGLKRAGFTGGWLEKTE